jgi:hypothetical protein
MRKIIPIGFVIHTLQDNRSTTKKCVYSRHYHSAMRVATLELGYKDEKAKACTTNQGPNA